MLVATSRGSMIPNSSATPEVQLQVARDSAGISVTFFPEAYALSNVQDDKESSIKANAEKPTAKMTTLAKARNQATKNSN